MHKITVALAVALVFTGCSGIRRNGDQITVHADSLNLIGFQIPGNDYEAANKLVPAGATIHTVNTTPSDWTSVLGVINRIIGIGYTEISATKSR